METAGNDALQKGGEVEQRRLGTPATRAGIIENLAGITQLKWNL